MTDQFIAIGAILVCAAAAAAFIRWAWPTDAQIDRMFGVDP